MIEGKKIILRAIELEDMECFRDMVNDPDVANKVVGWSFPISKFEQNEWYQKAIHDDKNKRFTIAIKTSDEAIGMVTLSNIDWQNRSATHGIKLHPGCPKCQGIGSDAVMTLMMYVFDEINLNRLDGSWLSENIASERLYLKCGWRIEGVKKRAIFRRGKYHDLVIAGITKEDYEKVKRSINAESE